MNILEDHVLVLNKHYLAVQVCSVREAILALYKGQAKVVDDFWETYSFDRWIKTSKDLDTPDKYTGKIHSPTVWFYAPQVIYLVDCEKGLPESAGIRFSRKNVMLRDMYTCQYCGMKGTTAELTLDHIIPRSRGGKSIYTNIVTACKDCNSKKANKTPEEAGMKLLSKPSIPRWKSHIGLPFSTAKKNYWQGFLK